MVDYNLDPAAIEEINKLGSVKAKRITELGYSQDASDSELVYNDKRCVLLTGDFRTIDESTYPPCQHEGIISLKEKRPSVATIVKCVKAFAQSGYRKFTSHNVIHLWTDRAVIHQHENVVDFVKF